MAAESRVFWKSGVNEAPSKDAVLQAYSESSTLIPQQKFPVWKELVHCNRVNLHEHSTYIPIQMESKTPCLACLTGLIISVQKCSKALTSRAYSIKNHY